MIVSDDKDQIDFLFLNNMSFGFIERGHFLGIKIR